MVVYIQIILQPDAVGNIMYRIPSEDLVLPHDVPHQPLPVLHPLPLLQKLLEKRLRRRYLGVEVLRHLAPNIPDVLLVQPVPRNQHALNRRCSDDPAPSEVLPDSEDGRFVEVTALHEVHLDVALQVDRGRRRVASQLLDLSAFG